MHAVRVPHRATEGQAWHARWKHGLYSAETRAEQKRAREAADPESGALETDANRLNRRLHGAWGSSDSQELLLANRGRLQTKSPRPTLVSEHSANRASPLGLEDRFAASALRRQSSAESSVSARRSCRSTKWVGNRGLPAIADHTDTIAGTVNDQSRVEVM
jgi:hypothetical protein